LVAHQGNQRGDHDCHAITHQRWKLETQGLSATGGHNRESVLANGHGIHDLLLTRTETVKAKDVAKKRGSAHAL